ncbi:MAG: hypothetical protein AMJ64_09860 [Betaproteobacteria bacterium SG8_39]|nr:MAG: hypothetical protein AMJ64_09860 [Betaproteobacteria bacterium SG8_39]
MDALKLFYEQQLDAKRRRTPDRSDGAAAAPCVAQVQVTPEPDCSPAAAPQLAEAEDTPERLLRHLEQHAGQSLRTCAAIDSYLAAQSGAQGDAPPARRSLLRETALVLFLAIAVLQYYYVDVSLEIAALNRITVFLPVKEQPPQDRRS